VPRRLLADQEPGIATHSNRTSHSGGIELDHRPAGAGARVVDHHVRHALGCDHGIEQAADLLRLGCLAGERGGRRLVRQ